MFNDIVDIKKYLLIQQLNDSIFPIGGYTQSYGLETYVQQQRVCNQQHFHQYLKQNILHNLLFNELLAAKLGYICAIEYNMQQLLFVDELISATKSAKEIRQASIKLGSRLFKTISKLGIKFDNNCFINYYQQVESGDYFGHHALAYGALCGSLDLQYDYCMLNFAYSQLSAMINTGVKLIPLSQTIGQQLLYALHPTLIEAIKRLEHLSVDDLGKTTPGFELRSIQHEKLYSRLYIS